MKTLYPDTWYILVEDKANGSAIIDMLSREYEGVIPVNPEGGKISRANAVAPVIESGRVFLPRYSDISVGLVRECAEFPNGAHDDRVDAMSQALNRMIFVDAHVDEIIEKKYSHWTADMYQDYESASAELREELLKL